MRCSNIINDNNAYYYGSRDDHDIENANSGILGDYSYNSIDDENPDLVIISVRNKYDNDGNTELLYCKRNSNNDKISINFIIDEDAVLITTV